MKKNALLSLLLLVPAPSIGVLAGMVIAPNQPIGKIIFTASKLWILLLPLIWLVVIEKKKPSLSKPTHGGFILASAIGILISILIFILYLTAGKTLIDPQVVKNMAANVGLATPKAYLTGAAYWILINAVLEEYVWRWFVVKQCRSLMPFTAAIVISALCFTLHHIIALQVYFNPLTTTITSTGVFLGGVIWSWCYLKYKSIWPGYVSHAIVDIVVFAIGYHLIFC